MRLGLALAMITSGLFLWLGGYGFGEKAGREEGRREQAVLTPAACREQQRIAEEALDNSKRAARGWLMCDVERETCLRELGRRADGGTP